MAIGGRIGAAAQIVGGGELLNLTGCGKAWLIRWFWKPENVGSNPITLTKINIIQPKGKYDMKTDKLMEELKRDEGVIYKIYKDHLGYPTFGIGHLIIEGDEEKGRPVGTPISEDRVTTAFDSDIELVLNDCVKLFSDFDELPEEAQRVIANMMFNMGYTRLNKFNNFKAAIKSRDWDRAADEMIDSRWYRQVTTRANRLVDRIRNLA